MSSSSFGQLPRETVFCGGTARLPHASGTGNAMLVVEVEIDPQSRSVVAVFVNPDLQGLKRLLESAVVGNSGADIQERAIRAIRERYLSPFRNAARAALLHALEVFARFDKEAPSPIAESKRKLAFPSWPTTPKT